MQLDGTVSNKHISTLVLDIYSQIKRRDGWFTDVLSAELAGEVSRRLQSQFSEDRNSRNHLSISKLGPKCPKALWHSVHTPELAEPLPSNAEIKYAYGHILEAFAITLSKAANHLVTGEQDAVSVDDVVGHRDCVIDGCIVDVKSCSPLQFAKYKNKTVALDDQFGYLDQLDGYMVGSATDSLVTVKDRAYILAIDKVLGHMVLYEHRLREERIRQRIREYKEIVGKDTAPACTCGTQAEGQSGNIKLDVKASYSPFKYVCFPYLRTFIYAKGPVYLTKVVRKPDVPEIDKYGNYVYS